MKGLWGRLALAGASLLVALLLAEALFRIAGITTPALSADAVWRAQSQTRPDDAFEPVRVHNVRFREARVPPSAFAPGNVRILFLGDSFTEGHGLPDASQRFTDLVEARLNQELISAGSPRRVHVFNAAKGASFPVHWLGYYRALEADYRPDLVFAVFFLRDGAPLSTSLRFNRALIDPIRERYRSLPGYRVSALARFFYERLAWRAFTAEFQERLRRAYLGSPADRETWRRQQEALLAIARDCRAKGRPFHLVIFPLLFDLDDYAFFDVEEAIAGFAREHDLPVFSLTPGFLGEDAESLWVASNDQHPNARGHAIAAATLLPYVREALRAQGLELP